MTLTTPRLSDDPSTAAEGDAVARRLVLAAAEQIATAGAAAASARSLARAASASPSAINYNFSGIEQLFRAAFREGSNQTVLWLSDRAQEISALPAGPEGAVLALEHVIGAWTGGSRPLALLYQEVLAAPFASEEALAWTALWARFWRDTAEGFGLEAGAARLMHVLFQSEALYNLSTWSPALEGGALRELCAGFGALFLGLGHPQPVGLLALADQRAGASRSAVASPAAIKIMRAAAQVVEQQGFAGLTHRAVAAQADASTGSVTHHFRTIEQLTAGAIRGEVLAMNGGDSPPPPPASVDELFEGVRDYTVRVQPWGPSLRRRQLFLAAVRRPELAGTAAVIRFAHGGTVRASFECLFAPPRDLLYLYAGLTSRLISSSWFASAVDRDPHASQVAIVEALKAGVIRQLG